eukprot:553737_1
MAQQKDESIPKRCKKEKGRNLCLYSSTEYKREKADSATSNSLSQCDDVNIVHIKKKYFTNMYMLSKWSKFIRELYRNNTLDKFCNKTNDGTYVLGVPASSQAIENVVLAVNLENDQIINPHQGSVAWIQFYNVIDALDIANFLQIEDLLTTCFAVIRSTFPVRVGSQQTNYVDFHLTESKSSYHTTKHWYIGIPEIWKLKESGAANYTASYLMGLINYLQNKSFDWKCTDYSSPPVEKKRKLNNKQVAKQAVSVSSINSVIESLLLAFLSIDLKLISMDNKIKLFKKYVNTSDYAYDLFFRLSFMTFAKNGGTTLSRK